MNGRPTSIELCLIAVAVITSLASICAGQTTAAISGVPGDGIPDVYYFARAGSIATSEGVISRFAGVMTVDTDSADMVAVQIGGPNALDTTLTGGYLNESSPLPDPDNPPFFLSYWTVGYADGSTQWSRTAPLDTDGFRGVVCECYGFAPWPSLGLGNYGPDRSDSDFSRLFEDQASGEFFNVAYATHAAGDFLTNVTIVPEPGGLMLLLVGFLGVRKRASSAQI